MDKGYVQLTVDQQPYYQGYMSVHQLYLINKYGFREKLCSVRGVSFSSLDFAARKGDLPELMLEQANLAVNNDGADVIMGYGSLDVINYLRKNLSVPVLESIECTIVLAISLVRLRNLQLSEHT